jgi:hypothetical protein
MILFILDNENPRFNKYDMNIYFFISWIINKIKIRFVNSYYHYKLEYIHTYIYIYLIK